MIPPAFGPITIAPETVVQLARAEASACELMVTVVAVQTVEVCAGERKTLAI